MSASQARYPEFPDKLYLGDMVREPLPGHLTLVESYFLLLHEDYYSISMLPVSASLKKTLLPIP
jgi:hypothetical protein